MAVAKSIKPTCSHKCCTKCGIDKSANDFYTTTKTKTGLTSHCRACHNARIKRRLQDPEVLAKNKAYHREYRAKNREYINAYMHERLSDLAMLAEYRAYHNAYNATAKAKAARKAFDQTEAAKEKSRQRKSTPAARERTNARCRAPEARAKQKAYRHRPEVAERLRQWYRSEKGRAKLALREARKKGHPADFRASDVRFALQYWGNACAVCRKSFDGIKWCLDHWVPLSAPDCPGTIPSNMVPLCGHCNFTKHSAPAGVWLRREYPATAAGAEESVRVFLDKTRRYDHDRATRRPFGRPRRDDDLALRSCG